MLEENLHQAEFSLSSFGMIVQPCYMIIACFRKSVLIYWIIIKDDVI